jgi:hypothetical protein
MILKDEYKNQREEINHETLLQIRDLLKDIAHNQDLIWIVLVLILATQGC